MADFAIKTKEFLISTLTYATSKAIKHLHYIIMVKSMAGACCTCCD